jgi:hypothetical protein
MGAVTNIRLDASPKRDDMACLKHVFVFYGAAATPWVRLHHATAEILRLLEVGRSGVNYSPS